jgi:hypothetical protein
MNTALLHKTLDALMIVLTNEHEILSSENFDQATQWSPLKEELLQELYHQQTLLEEHAGKNRMSPQEKFSLQQKVEAMQELSEKNHFLLSCIQEVHHHFMHTLRTHIKKEVQLEHTYDAGARANVTKSSTCPPSTYAADL